MAIHSDIPMAGASKEEIREVTREELTSGDPNVKKDMREITREEITSPVSTFFTQPDGTLWDSLLLSAGGATTDAMDTIKFGVKTIFFQSDTEGTLTIEVKSPSETATEPWLTYDTISAGIGTVESYIMSAQVMALRLKFSTTDETATPTVTAWIVMRHI